MRAHFLMGSIFAAAVAMWSCGGGGGGYNSSSPSTPSPTPAPAPAAPNTVTVSIVDTNGGAKAFTPNPVQAATGASMVWTNNTRDTHHLVMDDGSAVIGDITPGASSAPMQLRGSGANYHCTNHPSMVGSINGATVPAPPPSDSPSPGDGY
jgi:plastocyanin